MRLYLVGGGVQFALCTVARPWGMTPMSRPNRGTFLSKYSSLFYSRGQSWTPRSILSCHWHPPLLTFRRNLCFSVVAAHQNPLGNFQKYQSADCISRDSDLLALWRRAWATSFQRFPGNFDVWLMCRTTDLLQSLWDPERGSNLLKVMKQIGCLLTTHIDS